MTDSQQLLAEYVRTGSDRAFCQLVTRYVDLVYSTALRLVNGDSHRAEDVAQTVFIDLARLARTLSGDVMPGGWLHRHTCFVAANTMRGERRRQSRERQAVEMNALQTNSGADFSLVAPMLDEAINELDEADRAAILLRFFEQRDFRSVGQALGGSEDAARMRVNRALEKLESLLKRRNITASSAALAGVLGANAVQAAPAGLAVTISAAALVGTSIATTAVATATKAIAMTTLQKTLVSTTLAVCVATPLVIQHQNQAKLRAENAALHLQIHQQAQLQAENERLSNLVARFNSSQPLPNDQFQELLKLRGEVGLLRQRTNLVEKLQDENRTLRSRLAAKPNAPAPKTPPDVAPQDIYPRESWSAAGYADPRSAFQSVVLATTRGDEQAYLAGLSPEMLQMRQKEIADATQLTGKSEADLAAETIQQYKVVTGYRILDQQTVSDDQVLLHVYLDGVGVEKSVRMKKIGNEWKMDAAP